jgi:hypothetical protein
MIVGLAVASSLLLAGRAAWAHITPDKAKSIKAELTQGYLECTAPDTTTSAGLPACAEQAEIDPACIFAGGSGKLSATISKSDVKVSASLKGLDCEGQTLQAYFDIRTTSDDCPTAGGHCTAQDAELVAGSCVVTDGKCKIKATVPSGYTAGAGAASQILGCGVERGSLKTFSCGILNP